MPPPRLRLQLRELRRALQATTHSSRQQCRCASAAAVSAIEPPLPIEATFASKPPIQRFPPSQPPSHKRPEVRKTQLHRQYTSLLRASPLILIFQHNNLTSAEWMGIRRELARALHKADEELAAKSSDGKSDALADGIKFNIIQTGIFSAALRVVEFYDPSSAPAADTHSLSTAAHQATRRKESQKHGLEPLLAGPLAIVPFPALSPAHLAAVLRTLVPDAQFAAPKRKANPTYHEPVVQTGLQKLMLLGARVEGKVFDNAGVRWVGSLEGGLDGLRAQLVGLLAAAGSSLTSTLEMASKSVYFTVEGRRQQLEDDGKPKADEPPAAS